MTRRILRRAPVAAAALAALGTATLVPSAQAVTPGQQDGTPRARHCTAHADGGSLTCFDSFTAAMDAATGGRVSDAPASARGAAHDPRLRAQVRDQGRAGLGAADDGSVVQGTFFDGTGFAGDSLTITGSAPCKADGQVNYQFDLGDDWKNRVSSVQPWGDCHIWLYPEPNLGGDRDGPFEKNTADIGTFMNDRTQSIGFS